MTDERNAEAASARIRALALAQERAADLLDAAAQMQCGDMIDGYDELMNYCLEWEREMAGQSRLN